jgi:hypothetical protein
VDCDQDEHGRAEDSSDGQEDNPGRAGRGFDSGDLSKTAHAVDWPALGAMRINQPEDYNQRGKGNNEGATTSD